MRLFPASFSLYVALAQEFQKRGMTGRSCVALNAPRIKSNPRVAEYYWLLEKAAAGSKSK